MRLSPCVLVQPDGWARGEREGYGGPCDVTSLSLRKHPTQPQTQLAPAPLLEHAHGVHFKARREGPVINALHAAPPADREVQ